MCSTSWRLQNTPCAPLQLRSCSVKGPIKLDSSRVHMKIENFMSTYLFLLLTKIVNDDAHEKVQSEERSKDDKNHKVKVHVFVVFPRRLLFYLQTWTAHRKDHRPARWKGQGRQFTAQAFGASSLLEFVLWPRYLPLADTDNSMQKCHFQSSRNTGWQSNSGQRVEWGRTEAELGVTEGLGV